MKSLLKIIHIVLVAVFLLHSCNSDVFISDYAPSADEVRLSEKNPVSEIRFESSNWDIQSVYYMDDNGIYYNIDGEIYGNDGNRIVGNSSLCTNGMEWVKLVILHPDLRLTIERKDATRLVFSESENLDYKTRRIYISIGNRYSSKQIAVDLEPSTRYEVDSIVYTESYLAKDSMIQKRYAYGCINPTNKVSTFDIYPYHHFKTDYSFVNEHEWETVLTEEQLKIFGKDTPMVAVPVVNRYGSLVMSKVTLPLSADVHNLPLPDEMLEIKEAVNVSPNKQMACTIICWYKYYGVWYRIYASHPVTGGKRILEGLLDIYYPQSYEMECGEEMDFN